MNQKVRISLAIIYLTTTYALDCYVDKDADVIVESGYDLCIFEPGVTVNNIIHPSRYGISELVERARELQSVQTFLKKKEGSYSVMSLCSNNKAAKTEANTTKLVCFCNSDLCNRGNTVEHFLGHQVELDHARSMARMSD